MKLKKFEEVEVEKFKMKNSIWILPLRSVASISPPENVGCRVTLVGVIFLATSSFQDMDLRHLGRKYLVHARSQQLLLIVFV